MEVTILSTGWIIFIVVMVILAVITGVLIFLGKRYQKKNEEQQEQIDAAKQTVTMFVISKKRMKLNEAGLPAQVTASTPKLMRRSKLPILKVKIGPQIMNLVCDAKIFDSVPEKKEVKATVSGIYVTEVKGLRGKPVVKEAKKKGFFARALAAAQEKAGAKPVK
jgi:type II secretory pathway pseudopilin PulG